MKIRHLLTRGSRTLPRPETNKETNSEHWRRRGIFFGAAVLCVAAFPVLAAIDAETKFALDSLSFLIWGALVLWMCAGFTMLESGSVRTKNASVICLKNIGLFSIACITYYLIGYDLMYKDVNWVIGVPDFLAFGETPSPAETAMLNLAEGADATAATSEVVNQGYSGMSNWFFQMVFVATTASIVSGALAERVRLWSFFAFIFFLTCIIYPMVGAMTWGGGLLTEKLGFYDFAGSTIVHSTGGWAALMGVLIVGPRIGKFKSDGSIHPTPPSNVPIVTLGVLILWLGWLGFNGGSVLALGSAADSVIMSNVIANTCLSAAAGVIAALVLSGLVFHRMHLLVVLNGAIAGLVSITAAPDFHEHTYLALIIGFIGGALCTYSIRLFEIWKIDDVVAAIPAHLVAGVWGTMAVCFTKPDDSTFFGQLGGIIIVGLFVCATSFVVWFAVDKLLGLRISARTEELGQDTAELGIEAYPEFVLMPDAEMYMHAPEESEEATS